ncbi:MAG: endonuclease [Actinomycetia bacterium]|nr:endonuclease [Actinomycetes bacterium]
MGPGDQGVYEPFESRCADGLVEAVSGSCAEAGVPEVIVTVPVGVEKPVPTLDDGTPVSLDVIRRLACDATVRLLVENPDGTVAGYGRRRRIVPEKLRSRVRRRDQGCCRFPGCRRRRALRAHHLEHWADGGETDEGNCILLCHRHHVLVHEGGWHITGSPTDGSLTFHRPSGGAALPNTPAPARPDLLHRYGLDAA